MRILRSTCATLAAFTLALAPAFAGPDGGETSRPRYDEG